MEHFDIAIIGDGPAGATLARLLPERLSVVLVGRPGREKPCGGLVSPDAQRALSRFDLCLLKDVLVDPQIFSVRTVDLRTERVRYYPRSYLNVDRARFDGWLRSLVPDSVRMISDLCLSVAREAGGFRVVCQGAEFTASAVVGADGANSVVRSCLFPKARFRRCTAIQQWFRDINPSPFYSCVFDPDTSPFCSWSISKDSFFIFGGAFPARGAREAFEAQKRRLETFGFRFGEPVKTEACVVLRPLGRRLTCSRGAYLIGEAGGYISPSSFEGISLAMNTARILADCLSGVKSYRLYTLPLRLRLFLKTLKCPFMYNPFIRNIVMKSGLNAVKPYKGN